MRVNFFYLVYVFQRVDYYVDRTGFGVKKEAIHVVWEYKGPTVPKRSTMKLDNLSQVGLRKNRNMPTSKGPNDNCCI